MTDRHVYCVKFLFEIMKVENTVDVTYFYITNLTS